jgi:hypothetical protein
VLETRRKRGHHVQALADWPDVYDDLAFVWKAFWDLSRARPTGFGPAPIPPSDILAWMQIYQLPPDQRAEFYELLTAMDEEWMVWASKESERKRGNSKAAD